MTKPRPSPSVATIGPLTNRRRSFGRGKPSQAPSGSSTRVEADALLASEALPLVRKAIDLALTGDVTALRFCLDRLTPARKDRPVALALPEIRSVKDLPTATLAILNAVAAGDLTPSEAGELTKIVRTHIDALELADIDERVRFLEQEVKTCRG